MSNPHIIPQPHDGPILEWILPKIRVGICHESEGPDTWWLVQKDGEGDSGYLPGEWINWDAVQKSLTEVES